MKFFFKTLLELPVWSDVSRAQGRYVFERLCSADFAGPAVVPENAALWGEAPSLPAEQLFDDPAAEALGALTLLIGRAVENGSSALSQERAREELLRLPGEIEKHWNKKSGLLAFVRNGMVRERLRVLADLLISPDFLREEDARSPETDFFKDRSGKPRSSVLDLRAEPVAPEDGVSPAYAPEAAPEAGDLLKPLVFSMGNFYFARYYAAETAVARILSTKMGTPWPRFSFEDPSRADALRMVLDRLFSPNSLDGDTPSGPDWQKAAVGMSFLHPVTVITGGPGTGKTTTVAKLLAAIILLETASGSSGLSIALAAPTGKAAARMKESLGNSIGDPHIRLRERMEAAARDLGIDPARVFERYQECLNVPAVTLHSLLGMHPGSLKARRNCEFPLAQDLLIVDEVSMVDILLMQNLLKALKPESALIMLGDHNQLASVSAGTVLGDICSVLNRERHSGVSGRDLKLISGITGIAAGDLSPHNIADGIVKLVYSRRFNADSRIGRRAYSVNNPNSREMLDILGKQDRNELFWYDGKGGESGRSRDAVLAGLLCQKACPVGAAGHGSSGFQEYFETVLKSCGICTGKKSKDREENSLERELGAVFSAVNSFRVLTPVHDGVLGDKRLNQYINGKCFEYVRSRLASDNGSGVFLDEEWYPGKVFLVTRNNRDWDLHNGDVVIAGLDPAYPGSRRIWAERVSGGETEGAPEAGSPGQPVPGDQKKASGYVSLPFSMIPHLATGYVLTVHKSQGSEFLHTVIVMPEDNSENTSRELLYTGITRARKHLSLYGTEEIIKRAALRGTERSSGLAARLLINGKS